MERDYAADSQPLFAVCISTHTLTWSVTFVLGVKDTATNDFNSHAHVERDSMSWIVLTNGTRISTHTLTWSVTGVEGNVVDYEAISTHTLTWSVTGRTIQAGQIFEHFNSHAHVERDFFQIYMTFNWNNFNSHAHVERDAKITTTTRTIFNFNSHAHVERDGSTSVQKNEWKISTHTLTWSVTRRFQPADI